MIENEKSIFIQRFIDAYNSFDIEEMTRFLHPDIVFINIANGKENVHTIGMEQFKLVANQGKAYFSSRKQSIKAINISGENALVEIEFEGVLADDLPNGLKKGEKLKLDGKSEYHFENELIIKLVDTI